MKHTRGKLNTLRWTVWANLKDKSISNTLIVSNTDELVGSGDSMCGQSRSRKQVDQDWCKCRRSWDVGGREEKTGRSGSVQM